MAILASACLPCAAQQLAYPQHYSSTPGVPTIAGQNTSSTFPRFQVLPQSEGIQFLGPMASPTSGNGFSTNSNVQLAVELGGVTQYGYQPVQIRFTLAKPATRSRALRMMFHAGAYSNDRAAMTVESALVINKGDSSAHAELIVPRYEWWDGCGWRVWVDGELDNELSVEQADVPQRQGFVAISALVASTSVNAMQFQPALQVLGNGSADVVTRTPANLPDDWKLYTTFDVVICPAAEFAAWVPRAPKQSAALLRWVRAGGNLWLVDVGWTWNQLPGVEQATGIASAELSDPSADGEAPADDKPQTRAAADAALLTRGWRFVPLGERALEPVEGALALSDYDLDDEPEPAPTRQRRPTAPTGQPKLPTTSQEWFAVRAHGLGAITAFRASIQDVPPVGGALGAGNPGDPFAQGFDPSMGGPYGGQLGTMEAAIDPALVQNLNKSQEATLAVQRSLLMPRLPWTVRHGNKPDESNWEFNNLLIPGVGVAPVGQFQVLLSLFVLAIGPLNYWWLKRRKKLPMLVVTVPAAAAVVTLMLLGVGLFGDGLGVRVRARSLMVLDQTTGESARWARLTYYAGISPRDGLQLEHDSVVYPIMSNFAERRSRRGAFAKRSMAWDDEQQLTGGWLASRTPTQYLAIAASKSDKKLDLRLANGELRIVNRLGVTVTHLVVQADDGKMYWCEDLAPEAGRVVPVVTRSVVASKLRRLFLDNFPEFPPGADGSRYGSGYYGPALSKNLMDSQLDAVNSPVVRAWANGGYIAVTDRGVDLDLGVDNAVEEASFHVIRGTW
jgi:hypothetical protein